MPLFSSRKVLKDGNPEPTPPPQTNGVRDVTMAEPQKPKLVFHCQQAQGSPTGLISGFSNVKELYQKIAECYDFSADDVSLKSLNHLTIVACTKFIEDGFRRCTVLSFIEILNRRDTILFRAFSELLFCPRKDDTRFKVVYVGYNGSKAHILNNETKICRMQRCLHI